MTIRDVLDELVADLDHMGNKKVEFIDITLKYEPCSDCGSGTYSYNYGDEEE